MKKPGFETRVDTRTIDGVGDWVWPWEDSGLWLGPSQEWGAIRDIILEQCKSRHTVIQAGGGAGMYPRLLSDIFERVVTFEPDPVNFFCLAQNCESKRIIKFNAALGNENKWCTFNHPANNNRGTGSVAFERTYGGDSIMMRGDTFEYEKLDLIYLDIEGGEHYALMGLINSIKKHKPIIICENAHAGPINYLVDFGYEVIARSGADTVMKSL